MEPPALLDDSLSHLLSSWIENSYSPMSFPVELTPSESRGSFICDNLDTIILRLLEYHTKERVQNFLRNSGCDSLTSLGQVRSHFTKQMLDSILLNILFALILANFDQMLDSIHFTIYITVKRMQVESRQYVDKHKR